MRLSGSLAVPRTVAACVYKLLTLFRDDAAKRVRDAANRIGATWLLIETKPEKT
jgi:hypothetical protein